MVVIEGVTPRDSVTRPLPEDDIEPWLDASYGRSVTREEMAMFMRVVRHNPTFNRDDVLGVIYNFCVLQNFDARLLPDDDIVPWIYASEHAVIPEPVMDRFMHVVRHGFDIVRVRIILYNALYHQRRYIYSPDLRQLIQRAYQGIQ
jgi:hypothetical protein